MCWEITSRTIKDGLSFCFFPIIPEYIYITIETVLLIETLKLVL